MNPKLIDTHAHVNFGAFKDDSKDVLQKSIDNDIWVINVGSQSTTSTRTVELAEEFDKGIYAVVGIHPIHLYDAEEVTKIGKEEIRFKTRKEAFDASFYGNLVKSKKVKAIGEIGLDLYHLPEGHSQEEVLAVQTKAFIKQTEFAHQAGLPIVVHCRDAHPQMMKILKDQHDRGLLKSGGVMHSFLGTWQQAEFYFGLGLKISFNGIITFTDQYNEIVKKAPLEKILVETDCPYLTPVPYRGKRNLPEYVEYVAKEISEIKGIAFDEVSEQTTKNGIETFNL